MKTLQFHVLILPFYVLQKQNYESTLTVFNFFDTAKFLTACTSDMPLPNIMIKKGFERPCFVELEPVINFVPQ